MIKYGIAFSLWGDKYKYTEGMLKNIHLAAEHYPGWTVDIWHDSSVPKKTLRTLGDFPNVKLRKGEGSIVPVSWRFYQSVTTM